MRQPDKAIASSSAWVRKRFPLNFTASAKAQNSSPNPLIAVQARMARKTAALAGGPDSAVSVTKMNPYTAKKVCEFLLSGLDPADRRYVRNTIDISGPQQPVIPWFECLPEDATPEQTRRLMNGVGIGLLALGSAAGDTPTSTILQNASSMASRNLLAADPLSPVQPNEVTLASLLLQAFTVDPELKERIAKSDAFQRALAQCTEAAELMRPTEEAPSSGDPVEDAVYDCIKHQYPLGGRPLAGGFWSTIKDAFSGTKDKLEERAGEVAENVAGSVEGDIAEASEQDNVKAAEYYQSRLAYWKDRYAALYPNSPASDVQTMAQRAAAREAVARWGDNFTDPDHVLGSDVTGTGQSNPSTSGLITQETVDSAAKALQDAIKSMQAAESSVEDYKKKAKQQAEIQAKLQWANSFLNADSDVATILALSDPKFSDVDSFLSSVLSVLPAAKQTGSMSTLRSLLRAVRAAASKGDFSDESMMAILTGDPAAVDALAAAKLQLDESKG